MKSRRQMGKNTAVAATVEAGSLPVPPPPTIAPPPPPPQVEDVNADAVLDKAPAGPKRTTLTKKFEATETPAVVPPPPPPAPTVEPPHTRIGSNVATLFGLDESPEEEIEDDNDYGEDEPEPEDVQQEEEEEEEQTEQEPVEETQELVTEKEEVQDMPTEETDTPSETPKKAASKRSRRNWSQMSHEEQVDFMEGLRESLQRKASDHGLKVVLVPDQEEEELTTAARRVHHLDNIAASLAALKVLNVPDGIPDNCISYKELAGKSITELMELISNG